MGKIEKYRQNIIQLLENHSNIQPLKQEDIETQIIRHVSKLSTYERKRKVLEASSL
ncbi:MAG: hypothetical protein H7A23_21815 [Leptospiraceae bacterium]|nr:hypothetical protein [Leptospiraceae bacterium]